ncbi:MAG: ABC transporter substrate-binding protein [Flavobacteriales bacterium]|jgi:ABC-type transport system substrate-binding protein|nr:ABC transporter substrate-binding protein [Flavobacteriales bacterium]
MRSFIYIFFAIFAITSCGGEETVEDTSTKGKSRQVKGSKVKYGGTLHLAESEKNTSLFPAEVIDATSTKIVSQIHNGLVRFDGNDLSVLPAIAKDWNISDSQLEYTFYLRQNVFFHDDPCFNEGKGRKVSAQDVKYSFELLSQPEFSLNFNALLKDKLKGASEFYEGQADQISGIKIINDSTVTLTLTNPNNSFIYGLAHVSTSIIAKEAFEKYGKAMKVGTGPFLYNEPVDGQKDIYLTFNPNFYLMDEEGNQLPYLDTVHFHFESSKIKELELFRKGKLSIIHGLPGSKIASVISEDIANFNQIPPKTILDRKPEMGVNYYEFNLTRLPFSNKKVRQAFCYAIDKSKISTNILKGQGNIAKHGITPKIPTFSSYDYNILEGYTYNPERAKKLLAEAGYPNGKNFPYTRLEVNNDGGMHRLVANEIVNQIKSTLGINIELDQVSFKDKIEHSKYAKAEIFRSGWVADFPSPESFLILCYGKNVPQSLEEPSHPNTMRYVNPVFDSLFHLGSVAKSKKESYDYFVQAEKILIEDAPLMPLWYNEDYYLRKSEIRNFKYNPMEYYDLAEVYIKTLTKEEVLENRKKAAHQEGL